MNFRSTVYALIALCFSIVLSGCKVVSPDPGEAAVLVAKPWFFGHGGIEKETISTGQSYTYLSTDVKYINIYPQQYYSVFKDLMSADGVPLEFDTSIRLQVIDPVGLLQNFGENWYKNNVEQEFFNRVRTAVKKHGMNETAISTVAIDEIDQEVENSLRSYIDAAKLPVRLIKVTVGKANPPDAVKNQRIETAQQEQRVLTEQKRNLAEQSRKASETSRAEADNAYRNSLNLSPEQFVELERVKMMQNVCEHEHCTFIVGNLSNPVVVK